MFKEIMKWLKSDGKPHHLPEMRVETPEEQDARMVGEPVTSFLGSLKREPKRYKLESCQAWEVKAVKLDFEKYHWMRDTFGKLTDKKTGNVWYAYMHERELHEVYGLPFSLNHWEKKAIFKAFSVRRKAAEERKERIRVSGLRRKQKAEWAQEELDRAEYAKQFQEG